MLRVLAGVLVSLLVSACAGSGGASAPPSASSVWSAEMTQAPPAASTTPQPAPTTEPSPSGEVWDLLWVSDSTGSGGVPEAYAKRIETAEGVTVRVRNGWTGNLQASSVLNALRGANGGMLSSMGSGEFNLTDAVRDAEVIVISGSPDVQAKLGGSACAGRFDPAPSCGATPSCGADAYAPSESDLVAIFDEVFRIREGRPVILRTHDKYLPWGPRVTWQACQIVEPCVQCMQRQLSAAIHRAAAARGVPVAGYMAAFNSRTRTSRCRVHGSRMTASTRQPRARNTSRMSSRRSGSNRWRRLSDDAGQHGRCLTDASAPERLCPVSRVSPARRPVSRVLYRGLRRGDGHPSGAVGCPTAHAADPRAGQRASPPGEPGLRPPIWPCSGWSLPRFTPAPEGAGIVTVALVLASRRTGVTRHPALGSSDFPHAARLPGRRATIRPPRWPLKCTANRVLDPRRAAPGPSAAHAGHSPSGIGLIPALA